ncbi:SDR family NAD(P)-dependent oxidoreductase [Pseudorhodoferax sp.]|uniref:SDR family NAD(P)-dependent oxidoreductase n=1 Tax=Pseudorhodoferax sp. TaxID=1993553 RepID=UPI002DD640F0|nr:SDR family oxidoreductase [Pseudorhodoferax sp.]
MADRLKGKTVLVLGAGCVGEGWGNGSAAAVTFAREGANVVCADMNEEAAAHTAELVRKEGREALHLRANVAVADDMQRAVARTVERFGRIDVLHNNAGISDRAGPVEGTVANWDRVFDVNAKGAFLACQAAIPAMQRQGGGAIVHISSIASVGWTGHAMLSYQASKAALNQLTRMVAVQYAAENIRCNCILPGLIDSPRIYSTILPVFGGDVEKMRASRSKAVPMRRMGEVWDVANAALFFASDEAKYVTGVVMAVDGGITCTLPH